MENKGCKGNPDLVAIKGEEILLFEIIERVKRSGTFIDQLKRYTKIGKLIVVLPIDTTNMRVWGKQNLP
jgi:hypothetical protein